MDSPQFCVSDFQDLQILKDEMRERENMNSAQRKLLKWIDEKIALREKNA